MRAPSVTPEVQTRGIVEVEDLNPHSIHLRSLVAALEVHSDKRAWSWRVSFRKEDVL